MTSLMTGLDEVNAVIRTAAGLTAQGSRLTGVPCPAALHEAATARRLVLVSMGPA
jgi:hypothetical protein